MHWFEKDNGVQWLENETEKVEVQVVGTSSVMFILLVKI